MSRKSTWVGLLGAVLLAMLILPALAQQGGGGGGGGRGGPGMQMFNLEATLAAVAFEVKVSNEELIELLPTFQQAYDDRKAAVDEAREAQDFQIVGAAMQKIEAAVEAKLKAVLSEEQMAKYEAWKTAQAQMRQQMRQRGAGGGGRGAGGGGGGG